MKPDSSYAVLFKLLKLVKRHLVYAVIMFVAIAIQTGLSMVDPIFLGRIIDLLSVGGSQQKLIFLVLLLIGVIVGRIVLELVSSWATIIFSSKLIQTLREKLLSAVFKRDLIFYTHTHSQGDLLTRGTEDISIVEKFLTHAAVDPFTDIIRLSVSIIVMFTLEWRLAVLSLPLLLVAPAISSVWGDKIRACSKEQRQASVELVDHYNESIQNIDLIQTYSQENRRLREHGSLLDKYLYSTIRLLMYRVAGPMSAEIVSVLTGHGLILGLGGYFVLQGRMTVGALIAFFTYSARFAGPVKRLLRTNLELQRVAVSAQRILEVVDEEEPDISYREMNRDRNTSVVIQNLTLRYPGRDRKALDGVSLQGQEGQLIAVVGPNGSGKSTLARILLGLLRADSGSVLLNGVPIEEIHPQHLRKIVGYVDQEAKLIKGTIAENIAFGFPNASREEVVEYAKLVKLHDFVCSLPDKYNTVIGSGGRSLSGGERQKISLARCLIQKPKIIILDEPANALDAEATLELAEVINKLAEDKLVFYITHRLDAVQKADRIFVLDKGVLVAAGTHKELLQSDNPYSRYWEAAIS